MFTKTLGALLVALLLFPQPAIGAGREEPPAPVVEQSKPQLRRHLLQKVIHPQQLRQQLKL